MASISEVVRKRSGATVYVVHWREAGRPKKRRIGTDLQMARAFKEEMGRLEERLRGETLVDGASLVDRFLAAMKAKGLRQATLDYYARRLRLWLASVGNVPPHRWTRAMFDAHVAGRSWAPRTLGIEVACLRRLASWAAKGRITVPDVTEGVELPRTRTAPRPVLAPDDVDRLLAAAEGHRYASAVALAAYAGLSLGDLYALTWAEVDLERGWVVRPGGREKTGGALRVPILPQLAAVLKRVRPLHASGPVCRLPKSREGTAGPLRTLYRRAGLPEARGWHLLRHSFGTLLMRAGVPAVLIGRLLSHQPGSSVTARYQHPDDADLVAAMASLHRYLEERKA